MVIFRFNYSFMT